MTTGNCFGACIEYVRSRSGIDAYGSSSTKDNLKPSGFASAMATRRGGARWRFGVAKAMPWYTSMRTATCTSTSHGTSLTTSKVSVDVTRSNASRCTLTAHVLVMVRPSVTA